MNARDGGGPPCDIAGWPDSRGLKSADPRASGRASYWDLLLEAPALRAETSSSSSLVEGVTSGSGSLASWVRPVAHAPSVAAASKANSAFCTFISLLLDQTSTVPTLTVSSSLQIILWDGR